MKKTDFWLGLAYIALGLGVLFVALRLAEESMGGVFFGIAGALLGGGLMLIGKYLYWSRPGYKEKYAQRLEMGAIDQGDELKQRLRDKSGRVTYNIGLLVISISIFVYAILGAFGIMETRHMASYLGIYLISQVVLGIVVFYRMLREYE